MSQVQTKSFLPTKRAQGSLSGLVLQHIKGGKTITEAASAIGVSKQNVVNTVKRLQGNGDLDPNKTYR